ncbi:MAG: YbdK family carboxylate-amine ligase, partial [Gemmatimonadetes bacterium]|nr:YbdK family carboxylate-amine ligase [Gemmatimonadota bacterium]
CPTVQEVRADLERAVRRLQRACAVVGVDLAGAGSHPFAKHRERLVFPSERFHFLIDRNRWMARRLMIFGMHVHLGMRDGEHAMAIQSALLHYLPHALALSASSPYWQGSDTGLASSRITIFEALPTAGHPCLFRDWGEFQQFYASAVRSRAITSIKDLWWDIRPHPDYGTIEIRICDGLPTINEAVNLVGFLHCLVSWLDQRHRDGERFAPPAYWILRENKWRASRWGIEAEIVMDEEGHTSPIVVEIERLLEALEPLAAGLSCTDELRGVGWILARGISYERQRAVYDVTRDLVMVTEALIEEFQTGRPFGG